ncbi:MAG: type I DNA topoisomerase [Cyanobacteriota bacterium]|nr:type I DNA topoisomerase [Cyanobacteriota bacterium]
MSTLVIVESPTKARTISNFLPRDYRVEASMGHVRDLPPSADEIPEKYKGEKWAPLGVNVESNFEPIYVVPKDKKKVVKELKDALKVADELVLATDEDREGESISWHLLQLLQPKIPTKRMVFHEITQEAIQSALRNCRDLDEQLVHAQETRRILDRLYGYTLSPLLWKKIARGLSAGRVQSVAVRLLVHRERERRAFRQGSYWDLKALLEKDKTPFEAKLTTIDGTKVATGSDFDENTGKIAEGRNVVLLNEADAMELKERLTDKPWTVSNIEERPTTRKPAPPFTTSTLQQESNRKLRLSARQTMQIAQGLYERGFITYMRTDSVHLSEQAIEAARTCVEEKYGKDYLSPKPRQYTTKSKGAQEAHEAIRPAGNRFRTPRDTDLGGNDLKLYDLIWKRTVACQMADSRQTNISVELKVENAGFRSSGKRIDFPGFLRAYVEGSDDPDAALENQEVLLPKLKEGDHPECQELEAVSHETQPPARFTEASLVKTLESEGVGRPSTYASVIGTIIDRGYAQLKGNALTPTFTAFAVTTLLEKHFPDLVDIHFTARMENTLDDIATGEANWLPYLQKFYSGDTGLETQVKEQESQIDAKVARTIELENLGGEADGVPYQVCIGKFGPYIQAQNPEKEDEVITASIPQDLTPADLTPELIQELLQQKTEGPEKLGLHPENGEAIFMLIGPYGPYVQLGEESEENKKPKRVSLPKGVEKDSVTLDMAVGLLSLPRLLGTHPDTGAKVKAAIGRFGPYVVHDQGKEGKDYRSIKAPDDVLTITLDRALEMLAQPKASRGGRRSATPLRELGGHPEDNEPVNVFNGPYGHYVKHGKTNASIPKEVAVEDVTLEQAVEWLKAKESSGTKSRKKTTRKSSSTTKKSTETTKKTTGTTKRSTSRKKASPES